MSHENFTITNETLLENNPFSDPTDMEAYEDSVHRKYYYFALELIDLVRFLISFGSIISDIYLIVIILRYKKLRKNRINILICLFISCNLMYFVFANFILIIIEICTRPSLDAYCIVSNMDHLYLTLYFYILTFLAMDWYVASYHALFYNKYTKAFRWSVTSTFGALAVSKWISTSVMCFKQTFKVYVLRMSLESFSFIQCCVIFIIIAILRRFRQPSSDIHKTEYAFTIPMYAILLSLPAYLTRLIFILLENQNSSRLYVLYIFESIAECCFAAQPMVLLVILGKINKYFRVAYLQCCCKKRVQNYTDDDLDTGSVDESAEAGQNNVTFDKNSEVIRF